MGFFDRFKKTAATRNDPALVQNVPDPRPVTNRGKMVNKPRPFMVGQRHKVGVAAHGGGGPENAGAMTTTQAGIPFTQDQPSWRWEFENDFFGPAAPSTKPVIVASYAQPSNSFRLLGDKFGGRQ